MIEMNQAEATKLFHRAEALQSHLMDVSSQLIEAENQFTETVVLPDNTVQSPGSETLTEIDVSARVHVSAVLGSLQILIRSHLQFLQQIKIQCLQAHGAILPETGTPQ